MDLAALTARWYKSIKQARDHHNVTCPLGPAIEVHLNPFDIEALQWEEGEEVAGLLLVSNNTVQPDRLRIVCAGDKANDTLKAKATPTVAPEPFHVPDYIPLKMPEPVFAQVVTSLW